MAFASLPVFFPFGAYATDPHRWLDLRNPYLGFSGRRRTACIEVHDIAPRVGEVGLGMTYEIGEEADEWACSWKVTKPDGTVHWYQGAIEDSAAILISDDTLFDQGGSYAFQAILYQSGRTWPQDCLSVYCVC